MILVAGSTGMVGGEVCNLLRAAGRPVRALVRATSAPEKVERLRALGCEIAVGNLRDRASLDAACRGVEAVVTTVSAMPFSWSPPENTIMAVDLNGQKALMDAAKAADVRHFTHITFSRNLGAGFPLGNAKRAAEDYLRASGMAYTILRPSFFTEVWLSPAAGFEPTNARATIYGSGQAPISWISYADVAQFAAASLDNSAARNTALELGGPEMLTPLEVVSLFEQASGRPFEITYMPEAAIAEQQAAAQDEMQASFAALMRCYAGGDRIPMEATLRAFPIAMTTVRAYAERAVVPHDVGVGA